MKPKYFLMDNQMRIFIYIPFNVVFHNKDDLKMGEMGGRAKATCQTVPEYNQTCQQSASKYTVLPNWKTAG